MGHDVGLATHPRAVIPGKKRIIIDFKAEERQEQLKQDIDWMFQGRSLAMASDFPVLTEENLILFTNQVGEFDKSGWYM